MNITTEFNIGDTVYAIERGNIKEFTVDQIDIHSSVFTEITYTMKSGIGADKGPTFREKLVGATPEALTEKMLKSFKK